MNSSKEINNTPEEVAQRTAKRRTEVLLKKKSQRNIFELTYLQKKQIQRQRRTIKEAFNHIKDPNQPILNEELINYSFQLGTSIELTLDPPTAKYGRKTLDIVDRYIDYRRNGLKPVPSNKKDTPKGKTNSKRPKNL